MNKTNKKLVVVIVALALALVASFGATFALLTAQTPGLVNTFVATAGLIKGGTTGNFTLTETGAVDNAQTYEGFIPGDKLQKDPKLTISTGVTASSYVFVEIVEDGNTYSGGKIISYNVNTTQWELVEGLTGAKGGLVYIYKAGEGNVLAKDGTVSSYILAGEGDGDLKNGFVKVADFNEGEVTTEPTITFYGYAMQSLADGGGAYANFGTAYTTAFGGTYQAPQA